MFKTCWSRRMLGTLPTQAIHRPLNSCQGHMERAFNLCSALQPFPLAHLALTSGSIPTRSIELITAPRDSERNLAEATMRSPAAGGVGGQGGSPWCMRLPYQAIISAADQHQC